MGKFTSSLGRDLNCWNKGRWIIGDLELIKNKLVTRVQDVALKENVFFLSQKEKAKLEKQFWYNLTRIFMISLLMLQGLKIFRDNFEIFVLRRVDRTKRRENFLYLQGPIIGVWIMNALEASIRCVCLLAHR